MVLWSVNLALSRCPTAASLDLYAKHAREAQAEVWNAFNILLLDWFCFWLEFFLPLICYPEVSSFKLNLFRHIWCAFLYLWKRAQENLLTRQHWWVISFWVSNETLVSTLIIITLRKEIYFFIDHAFVWINDDFNSHFDPKPTLCLGSVTQVGQRDPEQLAGQFPGKQAERRRCTLTPLQARIVSQFQKNHIPQNPICVKWFSAKISPLPPFFCWWSKFRLRSHLHPMHRHLTARCLTQNTEYRTLSSDLCNQHMSPPPADVCCGVRWWRPGREFRYIRPPLGPLLFAQKIIARPFSLCTHNIFFTFFTICRTNSFTENAKKKDQNGTLWFRVFLSAMYFQNSVHIFVTIFRIDSSSAPGGVAPSVGLRTPSPALRWRPCATNRTAPTTHLIVYTHTPGEIGFHW